DPRFVVPSREVEQRFSMNDLKAWIAQPLRHGYMEVTIVGDIDSDAALSVVAKTLGALPKRDAVKPNCAREREIRFAAATKSQEFKFVAQTPRAMSLIYWPTDGARNFARDLRTGVLADIVGDRLRLKIRQELGAAYTPVVSNFSPEAFPD